MTPSGHPARVGHLTNLKLALDARYERLHDTADHDEAIVIIRSAVALTPFDHPDRASRLANLGISLRARYLPTVASSDIDEAIAAHREALTPTPPDPAARATFLSNLSRALHSRFEQAKRTEHSMRMAQGPSRIGDREKVFTGVGRCGLHPTRIR
ncbi:hypothetical protein [Nocardia testacea]|uniref:hypothetical protein n=1 Tax=Nocardia testacea TaxID=248551 RepID=UPI003A899A52